MVDGVAIVRLRGELDLATVHDVRQLLDKARRTQASKVLVCLGGVSFVDAATVGVIVSAWSAARDSGQQLRVEGLVEQPARVFDVLGLRGLLVPPGPSVGTSGRIT